MPHVSILVIEDDEALRILFDALFTRKGFRVECVNDGAQGLLRLEQRAYDAVLLDLMMPICNGFDVLHILGEKHPELLRQIVVTTGVSERELSKVDRDGVFAVLRKPFDIDVLVSTILGCAGEQEKRLAGTANLERSIRGFESDLPRLRKTLMAPPAGECDLLLRHELRSAVGKLGEVLAAAAVLQSGSPRARRYARIARNVSTLATGHRMMPSRREH